MRWLQRSGYAETCPDSPYWTGFSPAQSIRQGRALRLRNAGKLELGAMATLMGDNEFIFE